MRIDTSMFRSTAIALGMMVGSTAMAVEKSPAPINKIFVPVSFDSNDSVEIVLRGELPDLCHKVAPAEVQIDRENRTITVSPYMYSDTEQNRLCILLQNPFNQTVAIGQLDPGDYSVVLKDQPDFPIQKLKIASSKNSEADDFIYAPASNGRVEQKENGDRYLVLTGEWPIVEFGCMKLKDLKVQKVRADLMEVLPIIDFAKKEECAEELQTNFRFETRLADQLLAPGVLHVRVMNGMALNVQWN